MTEEKNKGILFVAERISRISILLCGAVLFGMAGFIGLEVLLRKFFAISTQGAEEYSSYAMALISAWAFSYTLFHKGHIRIDVFYTKCGNFRKKFLDLASLAALGAFAFPVTWYAWSVFYRSYEINARANTPLQTPLWIPQLAWFGGLVFFCLVILLLGLLTLSRILRGDMAGAALLSGCPELEEDVKEESGLDLGSLEIKSGKGENVL